jgi:hypothetical protein
MKKTILIGISTLLLVFSSVVKAEISLSGYSEFFAGSADQSLYKASANHGLDQSGFSNGNYSRITANYDSTLDSGIEVSGVYTVTGRDCQGDKTGNCNVVNFNFMTFSGGFGAVSVGERFDAGAAMLSRMTAGVPTGEPDGGQIGAFYTADGDNTYGNANEINYASNAMKMLYTSNVYSGFSFAVGYTPNSGETGANNISGQYTDGTSWNSFNDVVSMFGKYVAEMDGIGLELVYGQNNGNAGREVTVDYNDLEETAYSAKITYAGFSADYRKNEADNSGLAKNGTAGNNEGTSVCGQYVMGNARVAACQVDTSYTDASNLSNGAETRTFSADYNLGGGVTLGIVYFDVEQTANGVIRTDVDGIATKLSVGF